MENVGLLLNQRHVLVTEDAENAELLNAFFPQPSLMRLGFRTPRPQNQEKKAGRRTTPWAIEGLIRYHLGNLNIHKSKGSDGMNSQVLMESAGVATFSAICEKLRRRGEVPGDWMKTNFTPISKNGKWKDPGNYQPASQPYLSSWKGDETDHSGDHQKACRRQEGHQEYRNSQDGFSRGNHA